MSSFEEQIAIYNEWSNEYCSKVIAEYERFIILRSNNFNIFPSDDIKDVWHFHILNTEMYSKFCLEKFGKIIHYSPIEMLNTEIKKNNLINTIISYKNLFGNFLYPEVWECNLKMCVLDLENLNKNNITNISTFQNNNNSIFPPNNNSFVPPNNSIIPPNNNSFVPPNNSFVPNNNSFVPPNNNIFAPNNSIISPNNNSFVPPNNSFVPPNNNSFVPPNNSFVPPNNKIFVPPNNNIIPNNSFVPPNNNSFVPNNNSFVPPNNNSIISPNNNNFVPQNNKIFVPPNNNNIIPNNSFIPPNNIFVFPQTNNSLKTNITELEKNNSIPIQPKDEIPDYYKHKPKLNEIKIYIFYKNSLKDALFNKEIVPYDPKDGDNISRLKDIITKDAKINKNQIKLYIHPQINIADNDKNTIMLNTNILFEHILLKYLIDKSYNFLICEISEVNNNLFNNSFRDSSYKSIK